MTLMNRQLVKGLLLLASLITIAVLLKLYVFDENLSSDSIKEMLGPNLPNAMMIYLVVAAVATMLGLPRQAIAFAAGYCFGFTYGLVISTLAATLGCMLCFYISRHLAFDYIQRKHTARIAHINQFMSKDVFVKTLIIRLLPVGSNLVTNLVAGVAQIKARDFFMGSAIGYLPQMAIFALSGSGVSVESTSRLVISVCLFVICIILGGWLYKKYKNSNYVVNSN